MYPHDSCGGDGGGDEVDDDGHDDARQLFDAGSVCVSA